MLLETAPCKRAQSFIIEVTGALENRALNAQARCPPLGQSIFRAEDLDAHLAHLRDDLEGESAVRAAVAGNDLGPAIEPRKFALEPTQRDVARPRPVPQCKLIFGPTSSTVTCPCFMRRRRLSSPRDTGCSSSRWWTSDVSSPLLKKCFSQMPNACKYRVVWDSPDRLLLCPFVGGMMVYCSCCS